MNDLEGNVLSKVTKFADNTNLGGKVICTEDCDKIQYDLNKLIDWSEKWLLSFNTDNSRIMYIIDKNSNFEYKMRNQEIYNIKQEKNLGVIINSP